MVLSIMARAQCTSRSMREKRVEGFGILDVRHDRVLCAGGA